MRWNYYKLRQLFYYKVRLGFLQVATGITKCDDYYKLRQYNYPTLIFNKGIRVAVANPGPGCIKPTLKCPLKWVTYESVMGTLTGVAWNTLSTLVSSYFTW